MRAHPKADQEKKESVRLTKMFKRVGITGIACVLLPCQWLKRLVFRAKSPAEARAADKQHQSEVRRELRGLSPKAEAEAHKPTA
jgi:hypothetical protein